MQDSEREAFTPNPTDFFGGRRMAVTVLVTIQLPFYLLPLKKSLKGEKYLLNVYFLHVLLTSWDSLFRFLPDKFKGSTDRPPLQPSVRDIYPQVIYVAIVPRTNLYNVFLLNSPTQSRHFKSKERSFKSSFAIESFSGNIRPKISERINIIASCFAHLLVIQAGINMAYSAILLPQLMSPDSTLRVTTNEASWIASLMAISTPVGTLLCGPFMDLLGRKVFSLVTVVPLAASWFILTFTPNHVWFIYAARVLAGFGGGLTTVSLVYISEISSASWRPMLLCLNSVFVSLGILLTNVLGVLLPWRVVSLICGCITLASGAAILLYNPESPYWLLTFRPDSNRHFDEAKRSLRYLYNNQQMFTAEWDRLVKVSKAKRQEQEAAQEGRRNGLVGNVRHFSREFTKREVILPFSLLLTIFFFQQLSGTYPIIFYAVQVFQSIGGDFGAGLNADSATVILGVIRFSVSLLTTSLSRSFGRRFLLIVSGVGMTISSFAAALYFHRTCVFKSVFDVTDSSFNSTFLNTTTEMNVTSTLSPSTTGSSLLGLVFILVFVIMSSIGFLIIPWTLVGEILPVTVRATGGGIVFSYAYILMFGIVKVFPYMLSVLKISGLFYFFCFTSFANVVIVYFFLPETLGKSFEEIEKSFMKTHNNS